MEAAFFDLDKTVIARPSMVAFGGPLRREGLVSRRLVLRAVWAQAIYLTLGADENRLAKVRDAALRVSKGWEQRRVAALVRETLTEVVDPIVYNEALDLIRMHQDAGRKVFIVSASPEEIVAPLAQYLGADEAIATRAVLDDDGRYTGDVEFYCYGPEKARILAEVAARDGIDLSRSYAYSDSATDEPMMRAVGHAVAVNPDRELVRIAQEAGWEIMHFSHRVPMRERVSMPAASTVGKGTLVVGTAAAAGGLGYWWWREQRRSAADPVSPTGVWGAVAAGAEQVSRWAGEAARVAGRRAESVGRDAVQRGLPGREPLRRDGPSWLRSIRG